MRFCSNAGFLSGLLATEDQLRLNFLLGCLMRARKEAAAGLPCSSMPLFSPLDQESEVSRSLLHIMHD